jgi:hypothetical protein
MKLRRGFRAGADFLPALRALFRVENLLAQTDGFRRHFDVPVVGNELDRFLPLWLYCLMRGLLGFAFFPFFGIYIYPAVLARLG